MKQRQIKKNSKSAKDLLIKVFGYKKYSFGLSEFNSSMRGYDKKDYFQWLYYADPDYECGECDTFDTVDELYTKVTEFPKHKYPFLTPYIGDYYGHEMEMYELKIKKGWSCTNTLIHECRKLAKAGVKYG